MKSLVHEKIISFINCPKEVQQIQHNNVRTCSAETTLSSQLLPYYESTQIAWGYFSAHKNEHPVDQRLLLFLFG